MVFTTRACANVDTSGNPRSGASRWLRAACLGAWLAWSGAAPAAEPGTVREATLVSGSQGYTLDAEIGVALNRTLTDALERGIHLHFLLELEIVRPRGWWWFDEDIAETAYKKHLFYHLLLRRYVVETAAETHTVSSLADALALVGRVNGWRVLERSALEPGRTYQARLRLRLDTEQLPRPLSIGAVSGDKWEFATPWHEWSFEAAPPP